MKIARLVLLMLALTVSTAAANLGGGNFGSSTQGGEESIGGSNATTCEWYWIDCDGGGIDEWCCGSFGSCEGYCAEYCGARCEYVPNVE